MVTPELFLDAARQELERGNTDLTMYFLQRAADLVTRMKPDDIGDITKQDFESSWWGTYWFVFNTIVEIVQSMPRQPPHKAMVLFPRR